MEFLAKNSSSVDDEHRRQFEDEIFNLFLEVDLSSQNKIDVIHVKLNDAQQMLNKKNDELIQTIHQSHQLEKDLENVKNTTRSIVKYLNVSLKASTNIIARTIIEMTLRDHLNVLVTSVETLIVKFCEENNVTVRYLWKTSESIAMSILF